MKEYLPKFFFCASVIVFFIVSTYLFPICITIKTPRHNSDKRFYDELPIGIPDFSDLGTMSVSISNVPTLDVDIIDDPLKVKLDGVDSITPLDIKIDQ